MIKNKGLRVNMENLNENRENMVQAKSMIRVDRSMHRVEIWCSESKTFINLNLLLS